ncbi:TniQ family protein [Methylobacterium thuringiense]|uniref:TniQ domain-containing protein n=1 Tax=Methylobacterium thuringiense TaxID=1003091 RepID=A0ABQ4TMF5_9HYPH|nr:TniQ family protein [Methylobacterium thuringiense]GJE54875.1 hypothetical protein EKPJFOCH_1360 [Methylobacterium thuringiense]
MATFCDPYHPDQPPLPTWRSPRPGEPAHGFVVRHAGLNHRSSVRTMLIGHGLNGRHPQPHECLEFALSIPFEGHEALVHATPTVSPDGVTLMGQVVRRRQWQIDLRRFCPACLAEDAYHRTWWDLPDFRRCPHHDLDLLDRDGNGRPLPWWSPSFERSPSGLALARFGIPRRERPRSSVEAYILGRLGAVEAEGVPILDRLATLGDALDAIRLLGRIALWGEERSRPALDVDGSKGVVDVMRVGYAVAVRGVPGALALLHSVADARVGTDAGRVKKSCFGWIPDALWREERGSHGELFEGLLDRVLVERNRSEHGRRGNEPDRAEGWVPLARLASELGLPVGRLRRVSQALGIHAEPEKHMRNRYLMLLAKETDLVRRTVLTLVDRDGAAASLGVARSLVDGLVGAGLLQPFAGIGRWRHKDHFRPEDVAALARRLLSASTPVAAAPDGLVRLATLERTHRRDPARLITRLLDEGGASIPRLGPKVGDLLLPERAQSGTPEAVAAENPPRRAPASISRYDAASLIGCQVGTVDALLDAGLIAPAPSGTRRVEPRSVAGFRATWAAAETYRDALGLKAGDRRTGRRLEDLGVTVRRLTLADGYAAYMVDRASARTVLGLPHDPDAPEGGGARAFEAALLQELGRIGSFRRNGRAGRLALISTAGDLALYVTIHGAEQAVVLDLSRYCARGSGLDAQIRFAHAATEGRLHVRQCEGRLRATLRIPMPRLPEPKSWPDLLAQVAAATELFRSAFPPRRRSRAQLPDRSGRSPRPDPPAGSSSPTQAEAYP